MTLQLRRDAEIAGYVAAGFFSLFQIPQLYKAWKTKSAADISVPMVYAIIIASVFTMYYSYYENLVPILIENIIVFIQACTLLFLVHLYT